MNLLRYSKILIVDDSRFFRVVIKKILTESEIGTIYYEAAEWKRSNFPVCYS